MLLHLAAKNMRHTTTNLCATRWCLLIVATTTVLLATPSMAQPTWEGSIVDYARYCTDIAGGEIPDFDCERDGVLIPITVKGTSTTTSNPATCDRPALIEPFNDHACQQGSRLGRLQFSDPNLSAVFICRATGDVVNERPTYEEVAIIQHNVASGATCWFRAATGQHPGEARPITGAVQSPLHSGTVNVRAGDDVDVQWQTASQFVCQSCHAADPYLLTPFVEQVRDATGRRVMPSVYDRVTPDQMRVWSPGQTDLDAIIGEKIVWESESRGQVCTECHAMVSTARTRPTSPVQTFTDAALGLTKAITNHGQNHAVDPKLAWMHTSTRPFELARPSASTTAAGADLMACMKAPRPGICRHEPIPGRPYRLLLLEVGGGFNGGGERITIPDTSFAVSGTLVNHDFSDHIRYVLRRAGVVIESRLASHRQVVSITPRCVDGEALELVATVVDVNGNAVVDVVQNGAVVERRQVLRCQEPARTRWSPQTMTLDAIPLPHRSGAIVGNVGGASSVPQPDFAIGDTVGDDTWRSYLQFDIDPGEAVGEPVAAVLTFQLRTEAGNPVGNLSDAYVLAYDYGDTFTWEDWNDPAAFRRGLARFAAVDGVVQVDVLEHLRSAWQAGRPVASFGMWFKMASDLDGTADRMGIVHTPRDDGQGGIDFNTTLQPVLTVLYGAP